MAKTNRHMQSSSSVDSSSGRRFSQLAGKAILYGSIIVAIALIAFAVYVQHRWSSSRIAGYLYTEQDFEIVMDRMLRHGGFERSKNLRLPDVTRMLYQMTIDLHPVTYSFYRETTDFQLLAPRARTEAEKMARQAKFNPGREADLHLVPDGSLDEAEYAIKFALTSKNHQYHTTASAYYLVLFDSEERLIGWMLAPPADAPEAPLR